jgi:hypothetical protein
MLDELSDVVLVPVGLLPLDARDLIVHPLLAALAAVVLLIPHARRTPTA